MLLKTCELGTVVPNRGFGLQVNIEQNKAETLGRDGHKVISALTCDDALQMSVKQEGSLNHNNTSSSTGKTSVEGTSELRTTANSVCRTSKHVSLPCVFLADIQYQRRHKELSGVELPLSSPLRSVHGPQERYV